VIGLPRVFCVVGFNEVAGSRTADEGRSAWRIEVCCMRVWWLYILFI